MAVVLNDGDGRRRPRRRRALAALAVMVGALVVAALVAEVLVLLAAGPQVRFPRHVVEAPWGLRYNQPGAVYHHRSGDGAWEFRINAQGMRADRDYAYAKPPGRKRVLSLGDSFTIGYEVSVDETFSAVLERELRGAGIDAVVMNAGVSGFSTAEAALYLERELLRYDPDLVILSFYVNDLVDNLRSGLFALDADGRVVPAAPTYVPAGGLGNWLNRNPLFNALSGHSHAFAFLKERMTILMKRRMVEANQANVAGGDAAGDGEDPARERRLGAALITRMADTLAARGIPFVVHSIPARVEGPEPRLVDLLPRSDLADRPGVHVVAAADALAPHLGRTRLHNQRSHFHWTPFAHALAGQALARRILEEGLLGGDRER